MQLSVQQLTQLFETLADRFPFSAAEREAWVEHCVLAELRGNIMQGLRHLGYHWFQRFTDGTTSFGQSIEVVRETPAMAVLDAHGVMGAYTAKFAMDFACQRAKRVGAFILTVRNSPDWMMMGYSARQALKYDCIGVALANSRPEVAPWGGSSRVYGMNPIAAAVPTERHFPILIDMSSSDSGGLKVQEQLLRGEVPKDLFLDASGRVVTDPSLWGTENMSWGIPGGAQKMSGYRDLALTVLTDALGGALSGMKCALDLNVPEPIVNGVRTPRGQAVIAIDIDQFTPLADFKAKVDRAIDQAKASPRAPGFEEILMPGERGYREEQRRRIEGVPVDERVWRDVVRWCSDIGVDADAAIRVPASPS